jgi:predicted branched-subunit amino acid permease
MPRPAIRRAFLTGVRDGAPFVLVIVPFGLLFGVVASEAGWDIAQTMAMTVLVIAGASQFTALQLISEQAPVLIVIVTALAVNLRLAMYSASLAPQVGAAPLWQRALLAYVLVDQTYGASVNRAAIQPGMRAGERVAHFFGAAAPIVPVWYGFTWVGAVAGAAIPEALALDFAVPITFIAMVAPMLRTLPHVVAAFVSVAVALALAWLPFSLGLLVAAGLAMVAGALTEAWLEARRA